MPHDGELGYDLPALPGMAEHEVQTPCLVVDLDALEHNIRAMGAQARRHGVALRPHAKTHKSVDIARLQQEIGGATGICCQKVSEAEAFARGGLRDILVSNQVRDPLKIRRLAALPRWGARVSVCIDDIANVAELSAAAAAQGTTLDALVELDVGAGRCGVATAAEAVAIARAIDAAPSLRFRGLQAYQGALQHVATFEERHAAFAPVAEQVRETLAALRAAGLEAPAVTGGGTGSWPLEAASGLYTELQCGSYIFLDADYGRILDEDGRRLDEGAWQNALFLLTSVMSHARPDIAICDAGLKAQSVDSGLPTVFGRDDVTYVACSDEHGTLADPAGGLAINDRLRLVPGHCDPTCNLHDWYVGLRRGVVETLWPISARGKAY